MTQHDRMVMMVVLWVINEDVLMSQQIAMMMIIESHALRGYAIHNQVVTIQIQIHGYIYDS
jgi:hypothetical protein